MSFYSAEAVIINQKDQSFDADERFRDAFCILHICSSLVTLSEHGIRDDKDVESLYNAKSDEIRTLRLAHYSVKEFKISERIQEGKANFFAVTCMQIVTSLNLHNLEYALSKRVLYSGMSLHSSRQRLLKSLKASPKVPSSISL